MRTQLTEKTWYDPDVKNYVMLDVTDDISPLPEQTIDGTLLLPKAEYHCTLVPAGKLLEDAAAVQRLIADTGEYLAVNPVTFEGLGGEYFLCRKDDETTLIGSVRLAGLAGLRQVISRHVPDYLPPFPHVTLLKSANSPYGIGVNSEAELSQYCRVLETPLA